MGGEFSPSLATQKRKPSAIHSKDCCEQKKSQSCQISRKCFLKFTYLDNRFHVYISSILWFQKFSESFQNLEIFFNLKLLFFPSQCKCFGQNQKLLVPRGHKNIARFLLSFFSPSYLTCSQIWLIPLVDDCLGDYITKLEEKKKEKKPACKSSIKTEFLCLNSDGWVKL